MSNKPRTTPDSAGQTNDRDPAAERDGIESEHNRGHLRQGSGGQGYDDAARRRTNVEHEDLGDVDPDSAKSDVDRDDSVTD